MYRILHKSKLNKDVERMVVHAPYVARRCLAGQFIILRPEENGERIPLTIADYNREEESVTIIYQVVGYSTKKLSQLEEGDTIPDFVGPLGESAPIHNHKKVLGIGGGVGSAPLYPQLKALKASGAQVDAILGGRSKDYLILTEEFEALCQNVHYATNDGSMGKEGFVTDVLKEIIGKTSYDLVIAIGPLMMMKAVCEITKEKHIPTNVSLNPIMIDGTGMCGGCRVTVGGKVKFACVDGPDFNGHLVDFDECIRRQSMYKDEEHQCRLGMGGVRHA